MRGTEQPMVLSTGTRTMSSCMRTRTSGAWLPLSPYDLRDLVLHSIYKKFSLYSLDFPKINFRHRLVACLTYLSILAKADKLIMLSQRRKNY